MGDFTDKVVLITGAGRGIGRAVAQRFATHGAVVAANDLTSVNLDETLAPILAAGKQAGEYIFDVAKQMPVQAMVQQVVEDWGRIDILVNCASVKPYASILEMDEWAWHRTVDVNLGGVFFTMQAVGKVMRLQGEGVIVNIVSVAGNSNGLEGYAAYVASETGLLGLTRAAAAEFGAYSIRINAVCLDLLADAGEPGTQAGEISPGRARLLDDAAEIVLFLCSPAAAHLTGQVVNVDGGLVMS